MTEADAQDRRGTVALILLFGAVVWFSAQTSQDVQLFVRAAAWTASGLIAVLIGGRRRPEPSAAWQVLGLGAVLIGGSWLARALYPEVRGLGEWPDLLSGAGFLLAGAGLLLAGRSRRERVALLDGAILAGAVITFAWAVIIAPRIDDVVGNGSAEIGSAAMHVAGGTLVVSVGVAIALAAGSSLGRATWLASLGVLSALVAAVGWAYQGLAGAEQSLGGSAAWLLAPAVVAIVAFARDPVSLDEEVASSEITTARYMLLVLLVIMPSLTIGIISAVPGNEMQASEQQSDSVLLLGIWVTISSVLFLAARIWASAGFALEDERALAQLRFQRLIEHSADVVCLVSSKGKVFYASPSIGRVLGRAADDLVGKRFDDLILAEDRDDLSALMNHAIRQQGNAVPLRLRVVTADGKVRPAEGTITDLTAVAGVEGIVVTIRDVSKRVALEEELTRAALEDPLTGLANRTRLTDRMRHAMAQRATDHEQDADGRTLGLLFVDLDDFKTINDGLGHVAGDEVLKVVAERINGVIREADTAARLGGDEFAIFLESLSPLDPEQAAHNVAQRLITNMAKPIEVAGESVRVRLSVGLAMSRDGMSEEELIQNADVAMYSAKQAGLSFAAYDTGMASRARRRLLLTQDLEAALDANDVDLRYQPIVALPSGELVGVEALMRWHHPTFGRIPANEVEDLAVRGGLADKMTEWAFERVRADKSRWLARTGEPLKVGVNLAARQLTGEVLRLFDRAFKEFPVGAPGIQIELTESALLRDATAAARILGELRQRGATIAIDDFGTGYASLAYLRKLPVDVVKIDREFVSELDAENADGSFAHLIQDLATRLKLETVAEGIETRVHLDAVIGLGCQFGQGFLFGRATTIDALLADHRMGMRRVSN